MWKFISVVFAAIWKLISGRTASEAERLGQEEVSNAQLRKGQEIIQKANDAAKKEAERNEPFDPNNRDDPRNRGV